MAITQTQTLPPKFIEDLATDYGAQLKATTAVPLKTAAFAPQVEGLDQFPDIADALANVIDHFGQKHEAGAHHGAPTPVSPEDEAYM